MYYYKLGYDIWDYTTRTVLTHTIKFDKSRFEAIIFKTVEEEMEHRLKKGLNYINRIEKMEDFFENIIKRLTNKNKGFKELKTEHSLIFDGDCSLHTTKNTTYTASLKLAKALKY